MFHAIQDKGFQIDFANGLTISVMFGSGNYCEHRYGQNCPTGSKDAEIAVFHTASEHGGYVFADGYTGTGSCGWLSPEIVGKAIGCVAAYQKEQPLQVLVDQLNNLDS